MLESRIQTAIERFLRRKEARGELVYQKNNSGAVLIPDRGRRMRLLRFGKKGSPDFLVWRTARDGGFCETLFMEVKKPKTGRQSPAQRRFQSAVEELGGRYVIVRSLDDAKALLS